MDTRIVSMVILLMQVASARAQVPPEPVAPEFPVPSSLPDAMRSAPRSYDCTLARGLGDCSQTPGPTPAVQGAPLPPPRPLQPGRIEAPGVPPVPATPGVPKSQ